MRCQKHNRENCDQCFPKIEKEDGSFDFGDIAEEIVDSLFDVFGDS